MRWRPKDWPARKARRTREEQAWDESEVELTLQMVLQDHYSSGWQRPAWARLSRKQGWLTEAAYYALPMSERSPGIMDLMYRASPLMKMIRKERAA